MPISATGISTDRGMTLPRRCSRSASRGLGFTLIEVLVVVVIVGVISAVVLLSVGIGDDRSLERQARRLTSLVQLAGDEALMQGRDFGIEFSQSGYRFVELDPLFSRWYVVTSDDMLRTRTLDPGLTFELALEEREVVLSPELGSAPVREATEAGEDGDDDEPGSTRDDDDDDDDYAPHVMILSSGEITPFDLRIRRAADRREVEVHMSVTGEVEIETAEQAGF